MINFTNLGEFVCEFIESNEGIVYFGVGTQFYKQHDSNEWEFKLNQQFPPFLHDAKLKYFDKKILIVLIDPAFDDNFPYIVSSKNFLESSWIRSSSHSNLYLSEMGISVIVINGFVNWGPNRNEEYYNIEPLLLELCKCVSRPQNNSILFYHEFTGLNVIELENSIKKTFCFDDTKICIDITRGADLSCYPNLTNPANYPIITTDELSGRLEYLSPSSINKEKINQVVTQYKKFSFNNNFFSNNETNYLIDKPDDLVLYFQIISLDKILLRLVLDGIVSMIRQFYTMNEKKNFGTKMWGIKYFSLIQSKANFVCFDSVIEKLKFIDSINLDTSSIFDNDNIFNDVKMSVLDELYFILKSILVNIMIKYEVSEYEVEIFIGQLKNLKNKYELINYYKEFISQNIQNI